MTDKRYLTINRVAAASKDPDLDIDFLQGDVDINKLTTYDEADAFDKDGGPNLAKDDSAMADGTDIENSKHRGKLSGGKDYQPSPLELKRAEVAAKIAAYMLPNANAESIENQAAIMARRFTSSELKETLERCYCDRRGAKMAAARIEEKRRRIAAEEAELDEVSALADEMMGEGEEVPEDVAEDMQEEAGDLTIQHDDDPEIAGMMHGRTSAEGEEEAPEETEEAPAEPAPEDDLEAEASSRLTAGKRGTGRQVRNGKTASPRIDNPRRRTVTASEMAKIEEAKLSAIYDMKIGNPSKADFDKVMELFKD